MRLERDWSLSANALAQGVEDVGTRGLFFAAEGVAKHVETNASEILNLEIGPKPVKHQADGGSDLCIGGHSMAGGGISVIIPAYNVDGFIADAFSSVAAQTRPVHEILVIDDGSTDNTSAWLRNMARKDGRIRVLTSDRLGPSGARNVGLRAAAEPIIAFLDADDAWPPYKIERQMERLSAADRPDLVSGLIQRFHRFEFGTSGPGKPADTMVHVNLGACLFRRGVFDVVGPFDESLSYCEDVDLMFRVRENGLKVAIMREVTLYYRVRPGSLTQTQTTQDQGRGALKALRLSIGRRRRIGCTADLPLFTALIEE